MYLNKVFAYGQTGSGKTYTISGHESYAKRGIIPRSFSYIMKQKEELKHKLKIDLYVSYLEIYNEVAYDLLNIDNIDKEFGKWDRVHSFFDEVF